MVTDEWDRVVFADCKLKVRVDGKDVGRMGRTSDIEESLRSRETVSYRHVARGDSRSHLQQPETLARHVRDAEHGTGLFGRKAHRKLAGHAIVVDLCHQLRVSQRLCAVAATASKLDRNAQRLASFGSPETEGP